MPVLQRDLHANNFALANKTPLGLERFYLHLNFSQGALSSPLLEVSSRLRFALQLSASVSWRWDALQCWFRWNFQQILLCLEEYREVSSAVVQLLFLGL